MADVILVPTDGSPEAQQALDVALPMATACGFTIALLSARETSGDSGATEADLQTHLEALARARCEPLDVAWTVETPNTQPVEAILTAADANNVQFIVMTTHGHSGFHRWRLGSVADRVVHTATRPVVLVRPLEDVHVSSSFDRILVPLDGSEMSARALPHAITLARAGKASIILLRAVPGTVPALALPLDGYYLEADKSAEAQAVEELQAVAETVEGVDIETLATCGRPAAVIGEAAEDADLIVMASHGRGGLARLALGSVADAVIRHAGRPVMIVPSRDAD